MKLLVFAHTPPPHHGQSYMVGQMLEGFGGDRRNDGKKEQRGSEFGIECYHVNARLSKAIHDIGGFHPRKLLLLLGYCAQAIWCRLRYGVTNFYYVPAPGQRGALYRDWVVMLLCRPFFKRIIFHWHAAGLTEWVQETPQLLRWITQRLLGRPDLSIVLSGYNRRDGEWLRSRNVEIVHNGIPDPCPGFENEIQPRRVARTEARGKLTAGKALDGQERSRAGTDPEMIKLLYLSHCSREKGLFDALEAVALGNTQMELAGSPLRYRLTVAGKFINAAERAEFDVRIAKSDLKFQRQVDGRCLIEPAIEYVGFLEGANKSRALAESDCLCFPTYFHAESFGLVIIEAMAFGLPVVTTRWRSIPDLFADGYPGLVHPKSPTEIAEQLPVLMVRHWSLDLRGRFAQSFSLARHLTKLSEALQNAHVSQRTGPMLRKEVNVPAPIER
jgi:glycosyltransferase involved in cell wall biosynthesis